MKVGLGLFSCTQLPPASQRCKRRTYLRISYIDKPRWPVLDIIFVLPVIQKHRNAGSSGPVLSVGRDCKCEERAIIDDIEHRPAAYDVRSFQIDRTGEQEL